MGVAVTGFGMAIISYWRSSYSSSSPPSSKPLTHGGQDFKSCFKYALFIQALS